MKILIMFLTSFAQAPPPPPPTAAATASSSAAATATVAAAATATAAAAADADDTFYFLCPIYSSSRFFTPTVLSKKIKLQRKNS